VRPRRTVTAALAVTAILAGVVSAQEAEQRESVAWGALSGRFLGAAVALSGVGAGAESECAALSVGAFAARASTLGYEFGQLATLRMLVESDDPELREFAGPRADALHGLLPAVLERDLQLVDSYLGTELPERGAPPRFGETLRELESALEQARGLLAGDPDAGG